MPGTTHKIRIAVAALMLSVTAFAVPPALGFDNRSPDTRDAAGQAPPAIADGRSPDTIQATQAALRDHGAPDTWLLSVARTPGNAVRDGRSPDTRSAALAVQTRPGPAVSVVSVGFDWGDFGIGVGTAVGALLLAAGLAVGARQARRTQRRLGSA